MAEPKRPTTARSTDEAPPEETGWSMEDFQIDSEGRLTVDLSKLGRLQTELLLRPGIESGGIPGIVIRTLPPGTSPDPIKASPREPARGVLLWIPMARCWVPPNANCSIVCANPKSCDQ